MATRKSRAIKGARQVSTLVVGPADAKHWSGLDAIAHEAALTITEDPSTVAERLPGAEVLFVWAGAPYLESLWERAGAVRWVQSGLAGVDRLLFPGLVSGEVVLTNARGIFSASLAEYVVAAMLYFAKRIPEMSRLQRERVWRKVVPVDLAGATLGVLGLGDVGLAVARLAKGLGMRVVGIRRHQSAEPPPEVDLELPIERMAEALGGCDYLALCTPLTPRTRGLVGARELASLPRHAVLVNISRGGVLDEEALSAALETGGIAGAAVDVFEREPLPSESPLWTAPNLLISAHTVDNVAGWEERVVALFIDNFRRYVAGQPLLNVVDQRRGY